MANETGRMDFMLKDESHLFPSIFCRAGVLRIKQGYLSRFESMLQEDESWFIGDEEDD